VFVAPFGGAQQSLGAALDQVINDKLRTGASGRGNDRPSAIKPKLANKGDERIFTTRNPAAHFGTCHK